MFPLEVSSHLHSICKTKTLKFRDQNIQELLNSTYPTPKIPTFWCNFYAQPRTTTITNNGCKSVLKLL